MSGVAAARDGGVLVLRFDRPEKKNAITGLMYDALAEGIEFANGESEIGAILFLGVPGTFTAGNDIGDFVQMAGAAGGLGRPVLRFLHALAASDVPMVAGVDGPAIGVGTTLLLHCDAALATPRARFRTPFVDLGLVPEAASSLLAPRLMGHQRAFALLALGEMVMPDEALASGLVSRVVEPDALEQEALDVARRISEKPREALRIARRMLRGDTADVRRRIDEEAALFAERLQSPEAQTAFAAFLSRPRA